ncbi:RPM1-interacting protein 4 (RIN4) family protein [Striga asiatica]|uniref:RPM1-interacting protein 4 (RIN4) family protein n=1 Tax=Striga asiatica TaxID=4170 RepID=A0A5A7P2I1_STRAF|nr:RPM1-interacting protein 4 (RIN4) family protein [Striga asiatica]
MHPSSAMSDRSSFTTPTTAFDPISPAYTSRNRVDRARLVTRPVSTSTVTFSSISPARAMSSKKCSTRVMFVATISTNVPRPPSSSSSHAFAKWSGLKPGESTHTMSRSSSAHFSMIPSRGAFPRTTLTGGRPPRTHQGLTAICVSASTARDPVSAKSCAIVQPRADPIGTPFQREERALEVVPIREHVARLPIHLRVGRHIPELLVDFVSEIASAEGFHVPVLRDSDLVREVGLAHGEEAATQEGHVRVGRPEPVVLRVKLARENPGGQHGQVGCGSRQSAAAEPEEVGDDGPTGPKLDAVLVCADVAAAEGGPAGRDTGRVEHPVAVEDVVRARGEELRVWAGADVEPVEAWGEGPTDDRGTWGGRELVHGSVVLGKDEGRVDGRGDLSVEELGYVVVEGVEEGWFLEVVLLHWLNKGCGELED